MNINLRNKKLLIGGIHGSGKTHLAKFISRSFKSAIYSPYKEEWFSEPVYFLEHKDFIKDFPDICKIVKQMGLKGLIDLLVIDDSDLLFKSHFDTSPELRDLVIGHRHYNLAIIFITRRPQDIPARIYGVCEFLSFFSIESPHALNIMNQYKEDFGELVKSLIFGSYEFYLKEIGQNPIKMKV